MPPVQAENLVLGSQFLDNGRLVSGQVQIPGFHKNLEATPEFRLGELGGDEGAVAGKGYPGGKLIVVEQGRNLVEVGDERLVSIEGCVVVGIAADQRVTAVEHPDLAKSFESIEEFRMFADKAVVWTVVRHVAVIVWRHPVVEVRRGEDVAMGIDGGHGDLHVVLQAFCAGLLPLPMDTGRDDTLAEGFRDPHSKQVLGHAVDVNSLKLHLRADEFGGGLFQGI